MQLQSSVIQKFSGVPISDQEWLDHAAEYWLGMDYILRWDWNPITKTAAGFDVLGEGGIQATVKLSDRGMG